jgi:hypothetical protein
VIIFENIELLSASESGNVLLRGCYCQYLPIGGQAAESALTAARV